MNEKLLQNTSKHRVLILLKTIKYLEIALLMTKVPLLHTITSHGMATIKEMLDPIVLFIDLDIDLHIDMTLVIGISFLFSRK